MKTHTSKTALWLRSLIVLPLLAILIYGFSDKVEVQISPQQLRSHNYEDSFKNGVASKKTIEQYKTLVKKYKEKGFLSTHDATELKVIYGLIMSVKKKKPTKK